MRQHLAAALACLASVAGHPPAVRAQRPDTHLAPDTSWVTRSAIYEVFVRDFSTSGDLPGVTRGLDRIQSMGATTIWLMPIYPVGILHRKDPLGSPYAARDYRGINPAFGTAADFRALVRAVHARRMKLILDWVPNHTAWDNVWVKEHPDFYVRNDSGGLTVPRDDKGKLTDWTDVAQLDYHNPALRREMIAAMRYWLDEFGIDGFRVDAAGFVPDDFWRDALPALRAAAKRPILLLAEWGDPKMHRWGFDLTYSWDSYTSLKAVWKGAPASRFVQHTVTDLGALPPGGMRLRFTTNHDETAWDQPPVTLFGGGAGARAAFVAAALLPGRPLLYDGQEVESPQKLGLFVREAIAWNQPHGAEAQAFYRTVVRLATTDPAFLTGAFSAVVTTAPNDVIAYRRGDALVLANVRAKEARLEVTGFDPDRATDLLSNQVHHGATVTLPAYGAVVLVKR